MNVHYLIGDATDPIVKPALICHVCNSVNGWGHGFVIALSKKNKGPEEAYHKWYRDSRDTFLLGAIQIVPFAENVWVTNMISQKGIRWEGKVPPIRYDALEQCLSNAYRHAKDHSLTMHCPRLGAVLSGGHWPTIEAIIKKTMTVDTYVYTLESQKDRWPTQYENDLKKDQDSDTSKKYIGKDDAPETIVPSVLDAGAEPEDFVIPNDDQKVNGTDLNDLFR